MRKNRQHSSTGYYHNVIRGVNKEYIFYSSDDKKFFKLLLKKYGKKYKIKIHSYVLMNNHVHLLIEDKKSNLSKFMQVVTSVYARYFNRKYDRVGHLFQDRFDSEAIESEEYFVTVARYIIQNPEKAGISKASEYKWSSYNSYRKKRTFISTDILISYFGNIDLLYKFLDMQNNDECLEARLRPSEKEEFLIKKIKIILETDNPIISPDLPLKNIQIKVKKLRAAKISIRSISRITGLNKWLVTRLLSDNSSE